jgi:hypothetical protein
MAMTPRLNYTRPRIRLEEGKDPSALIDQLYKSMQGDRTNISVNENGELVGGPTGFSGQERRDLQKPQDPIDQHGPGYNPDTGHEWEHSGGDTRPDFDHYKAKSARGAAETATGRDATKSPFSKAGRKER